jgi:hypothetical protein
MSPGLIFLGLVIAQSGALIREDGMCPLYVFVPFTNAMYGT